MPIQFWKAGGRIEAYHAVRRFSREIGDDYPENTLAQALSAAEDYEHVREKNNDEESRAHELFIVKDSESSNSAIALLNDELDRMKEARDDLLGKMSKDDRAMLSKGTLDFDAVRNAITSWGQAYEKKKESEYTSAKGHFNRFCENMDAYSNLLSFIPDDDRYLKPFCGVLTTIVQASVNRGKIADGFASALADIGNEMSYSKDLLAALKSEKSVASTDKIVSFVAQLCTKIFRFLILYLQWGQSGWERFKSSLNKNYFDTKIQGPLDDIIKSSAYMTREANIQHLRIGIHMNEMLEQSLSRAQKRDLLQPDKFAKISSTQIDIMTSEITAKVLAGISGQAMLVSTAQKTAYDQNVDYSPKAQIGFQTQSPTSLAQKNPAQRSQHEYAFAEVELHSQCLGTFQTGFFTEGVQVPQKTAKAIFGPIQDWMSASESRTLWVYGPANASIPSDVSSTSSYVASTISTLNVPMIAYRCKPEDSETVSLISMVYSLIIQLVWLLPDTISTDRIFDASRFALLDGTTNTLNGALILMDDLLAEGPRLLVCVLDGIQMIEDGLADDEGRGTGRFLGLFLEILKESKEARVLKILLTTDGICHHLSELLGPEEQVDAINEAERFSGQRKNGRVSLANLTVSED